MKLVVPVSLLAVASASPFFGKRAAFTPGSTSSDSFPPKGTKVDSTLFPSEPVIGYPGPTPTGAEPEAIATALSYPANDNIFPLVASPISGDAPSNFSLTQNWGNLSPWYTVNSSFYGLPKASPLLPAGSDCEITQVHYLYRHGARYPTTGSFNSFNQKLANATAKGGFNASGPLTFLNTWTYKLGAELLTPFGRLQNFELGVEARQLYGHLLNNFTAQGTIPVFRTESQDRMVKTANNFAAGFFGVPEYLDEVNIQIIVEAGGFNNTGAPYYTCKNSNIASRGSIGSTVAAEYAATAFASTATRINSYVTGDLNFTASDMVPMLQLCAYETDALGSSAFCSLFTSKDFANFEYYYDLSFYYNNGAGSPVAAAQGKGFLEEFLARFEDQPITSYNSTTNSTLDSNPKTFPLNQSIYADATHEVVVLDALTAFNLTALFSSGPPPPTGRPASQSFIASQVVPFGTHLTIQILECPIYKPTKQIRFIVNDAVLPIQHSYPGCPYDDNGLCSLDTVITALRARVNEIDFDYDCFGNYTAKPGQDYNGRAPRS